MSGRLSPVDRLFAWGAAILAPPLVGTRLLKRVTAAASAPPGGERPQGDHASRLAALTEQHVRQLARCARAPRHIGLPILPGWRDTCLTRAYAATLALRSRGYPAALAIGVRTDTDGDAALTAHAWVTLGGLPVVDRQSEEYTELSPTPAGAARR